VAAADQFQLGAITGDLGQHGGDELPGAGPAGQAGLDPGRDRGQAVLLVRGLAEHAQHLRGGLQGGQALAFRIADHQPHPVPGRDDLVQVTADARLAGGRQVAHREPEGADLPRRRPQHDLLGGVGDQPDLG
jgi:hypothetical protein